MNVLSLFDGMSCGQIALNRANILYDTYYASEIDKYAIKVTKAFALTRTYYKGGGEATRQRNFHKSQRPIAWIDDNNTRHLTPLECERLQTVPEDYSSSVSKTQRLMMLGNGWTVDVIVHILRSNCG